MNTPKFLFSAAMVLFGALAHAAGGAGTYAITARYPIAGEGGWDYLNHDATHDRLYITRSTRVQVVESRSGRVEAEIPDTPGVHGVALAADLGKGYTSNGRGKSITAFDLQTLKTLSVTKTPLGDNPDYIAYDSSTQSIWAFNGSSHNATVLDARTDQLIATVALQGKPEAAVADGRGHIFVDIEDRNELAVLDVASARRVTSWALPGCEEPSGLAMDVEQRRLFVGCHNRTLLVLDSDTGVVVARLPIGEGVDAVAFDLERHLVFSSQGDGTLTIIQSAYADLYSVLQTVQTPRGAKTMALNSKTHEVYLMAAEYDQPPVTEGQPRPRRVVRPGSAYLVVVGPR